ncbi:hypothetical protein BGX26_004955 [Mortierella sp. AD094]|nr:hypothetical protein BGX26_004955 [Mortierella sp. AD094]
MSSSTPTVKDLYKVITSDFTTYLTTERSQEQDPPRETIQHYLDRFIRSNVTGQQNQGSTPATPSSAGGHLSSSATPALGNLSSGVGAALGASPSVAALSTPTTPIAGGISSSTAAGQRHANELWYQSLTNNAALQHSSSLPFAFHRLRQASGSAASPINSMPPLQNGSATGSPIIGGGAATTTPGNLHPIASGQATPILGANASLPSSPSVHSSSTPFAASNSTNTSLAAQRFSAHLITLYTQHGIDNAPISSIATRMLVYLTHLLPFLTPRLIITDWWDRLIEPTLQGEIKLEKEALKACRDLVTECMIRDNILDNQRSGNGSLLVAGDEEGQLDMSLTKVAMPIPQFVLRQYIITAHKLNRRLEDADRKEREVHVDGVSGGSWLKTNTSTQGHAGHGLGSSGLGFTTSSSNTHSTAQLRSEYPAVYHDMEKQHQLHSNARTVIRRKKDILFKNLETILFSYGSGVGRVKDFFSCLYTYFVGARFRAEVLGLLCQYIRRQSFDEFDDEHTNTGLAITDGSKVARDEHNKSSLPEDIEFEDISLYSHGIRWRRYGPSLLGGTTEGAPDPTAIFSFLYGLFPCNLLEFLHSPRKYMRQVFSPSGSPKQGSEPRLGEEDTSTKSPDGMSTQDAIDKGLYIDEDLLKSRVQPLLKRHSLHPDLLTLTTEQEIVDKTRWQKLEPMEIVAMCVGLDVWSAGGLYGMGPVLKSIEDDSRGALQDDTDYETDDNETLATRPQSPRRMSESLSELSPKNSNQYLQPQARTSVESLGSEGSADTPIEILAQEDFFGPRAPKESQPQFLPQTSVPFHPRNHAGAAGVASPRVRTKSREVKMSQILKNFATLRGLDYEEFMAEAQNGRTLGPNITLKDRRPSLRISSESNPAPSTSTTTTPAAGGKEYDNIPLEDSMALTTQVEACQDSSFHPATMASLVLQNQEFRKTILQLERDLLMAKNELNFELFLKQQHIQQISKVHRAHVLDASVEAERQNLYNTCRSLKAQLQETKLLLEKEKNELEKRKNKQTHWDTELKNKMQTFRDERKQLQFEVERLKQDIKDTRQAQEIQERLLTDERKGTFHLKNTIEDLSPKLKRMEEYEKRIEEMTRQLVLWESEQTKALEMQRQIEVAVGRWQNLRLLFAAEKEESRILRNKVSQQSQILDDMRIQLAMNEGHGAEDMPETPSMEYLSEERELGDHRLERVEETEIENRDSTNGRIVESDHDIDNGQGSKVNGGHVNQEERSVHRKSSNTLLSRSHATEMSWPTGFTRSNSSQQGFEHQRKAVAMQEFMAREKERWDRELQESHIKWSREALRNQQLEDRILELQGQLELARAIDVRQNATFSGGQGVHSSGNLGGGGNGNTGMDNGSGMHLINFPAQPQNVPCTTAMGSTSRMKIHDQFGGDGDTDDSGLSGMIGRYSNRHHDDADDDDDMNSNSNVRRSKSVNYATEDIAKSTALATGKLNSSQQFEPHSSTTSDTKGKGAKTKSKSRWLIPAALERAQTDQGPYGTVGGSGIGVLQAHLASATPNLSRQSSTSTSSSQRQRNIDTNMATRSGSSAAAARATAGGLFPPLFHKGSNMSHLSDGANSDVTSASDTSSITGGGTHSGIKSDDDVDSSGHGGAGSESQSTSGSGKKGTRVLTEKEIERRKERERQREIERARLLSGAGALADPTKMYRNVRMF